MMDYTKVWTKQNCRVLDELEACGRYIAKREYVSLDLQDQASLVLETYDWLVQHGPDAANRPADVQLPVWVSFTREATMLLSKNTVLLELKVPASCITPINIAKWGAILNYSYIPADEEDAKRHRKLLEQYGIYDAKAYMTPFYPEIKREILCSWERLFDETVSMGNQEKYGTIWEMRKEWVTEIIK